MSEILEVVFHVVIDVVLPILFRVPGRILAQLFGLHRKADADGCFVWIVGLLFWSLLIGSVWLMVT